MITAMKNFHDLPIGVQNRVKALHPTDYEKWVFKKVPALSDKSLIEVLNEDDGYRKAVEYLGKVEGYLQ
ncbi:MAG: hypothetical protein JJU29_05955 [Verrucomicrobia bacterium]|nr:hypothetical protein [Verrucomicrobiota bacterium]